MKPNEAIGTKKKPVESIIVSQLLMTEFHKNTELEAIIYTWKT